MKTKSSIAPSVRRSSLSKTASHSKGSNKKRASTRNSILPKLLTIKRLPIIIFITLFAAVGSYFLIASRAMTDIITRDGSQLIYNGQPYYATGLNAFSLATTATTRHACGAYVSDEQILSFFNSLRPNSLVRVYAFQASNNNPESSGIDWASTDRLVRLAEASTSKVKLVPALLGGGNDCSDNMSFTRTTDQWWQGGYKTQADGFAGATNKLTDYEYVRQAVTRYKDRSGIGMWEIIGESLVNSCHADSGSWVRSFFDDIGGMVHSIDTNHLIESGALSNLQCGWQGPNWSMVHESPGIDVASWHDYGHDSTAMPPGLLQSMDEINRINKPFVMGEVGMYARDNVAGCMTLTQRRDLFKAKMDAFYSNGGDVYLPWNWALVATECDHYIVQSSDPVQNDPTLSLLRDYVFPNAHENIPTTKLNDNTMGTGLSQYEYVGSWGYAAAEPNAYLQDNHYSDSAGSYYQVRFNGTRISLYGAKAPNHGIAAVSVDGGTETLVDFFAPSRADQSLVYANNNLADGPHILKVRVTGTKNSQAASAYIPADLVDISTGSNITDTTAPIINITSPANGSTIGRSVTISATAIDNVKVTKMEIYIDGALKATSATGSISANWNSRKASNGSHTIVVKAYDAVGNVGQSSLTVYKN